MGIDRSAYMDTFREEMAEHLQALSEGLLSLANLDGRGSSVGEVFRHAHTIKGAARMMGFPRIADLAYAMEDVLEMVRSGKVEVTPQAVDALLASTDRLGEMLDAPAPDAAGDRDLLHRLELLRSPSSFIDRIEGTAASVTRATEGSSGGSMPGGDPPGASPESAVPHNTPSVAGLVRETSPRETVRIPVERIDNLLNLAGELAVLDSSRREWVAEYGRLLEMTHSVAESARRGDLEATADRARTLLEIASQGGKYCRSLASQEAGLVQEMHFQVSALRLLPVRSLFSQVPRAARDLAREKGKEIDVVVAGEETEVDREVLEGVRDPILHLIRNAIDHGIEAPALRVANGKPRKGRIRVAARSRGEQAIIEVEDDGAGVDVGLVRDSAVRKGLIGRSEADSLDLAECVRLLFLPGFSTRAAITDTSGRGVGLDVVKSQVESLKGTVRIETRPGLGTRVILEVPVTLTHTRVLQFELGGTTFALRCARILGVVGIATERIRTLQGREMAEVSGRAVPLVWMARLIGLRWSRPEVSTQVPAILLGSREKPIAFAVDRAVSDDNVIIKPLGRLAHKVPFVSGGIILGNGRVGLLLSATVLQEEAMKDAKGLAESHLPPRRDRARVLVVEDSTITRELERRILESAGFSVATAVDGIDALEKLRSEPFALVVSDVQMPRMDGIQLTTAIRANPELAGLPVVIVSSKETEEERRRGLGVGAHAYIGKGSFDQVTLLDIVDKLLERE